MATLAMPSPACPAPPAVSLDVPDTWRAQLSSGALMDVVFGADPQAGRLIVRHLVLVSDDLVDQVVDGFRSQTESAGGIADDPFQLRIDDRTATAFNTADDTSATGTARVVALGFFDESAEGPASGLMFIGEASGADREDRYAEIRDMVLSASFGRLVLDAPTPTDPRPESRPDPQTVSHDDEETDV